MTTGQWETTADAYVNLERRRVKNGWVTRKPDGPIRGFVRDPEHRLTWRDLHARRPAKTIEAAVQDTRPVSAPTRTTTIGAEVRRKR